MYRLVFFILSLLSIPESMTSQILGVPLVGQEAEL